jgi:hypothetical protein
VASGSAYWLVVPDLAVNLPHARFFSKQPEDAKLDRNRISTRPWGEHAIHEADGARKVVQHLDLFRLRMNLERLAQVCPLPLPPAPCPRAKPAILRHREASSSAGSRSACQVRDDTHHTVSLLHQDQVLFASRNLK